MLKLIKKDLLAARGLLGANLAALLLYSVQPYFSGSLILIFALILVVSSLAVVYFYEDRNKTDVLYLSLPLKRNSIVGARYVLAAGFLAAFGLIVFGVIAPLGSLLASGPAERDPFPLNSVEEVVLFVVIGAFMASLYLPFQHRFGFGRGSMAFLIVCVILITAGVAMILSIFPAKIDISNSGAGAGAFFAAFKDFRLSLGTPLFLAAAAAVVAGLFAVSLQLSRRFYARREY